MDGNQNKIKMVKKYKGVMIVANILLSLLILVALVDVLTVRATATAFSLLNWIAFGNGTAELVLAWIVGLIGGLTLIMLLIITIMSFLK